MILSASYSRNPFEWRMRFSFLAKWQEDCGRGLCLATGLVTQDIVFRAHQLADVTGLEQKKASCFQDALSLS
jgi:hypothetical protein